MKKLDIIILIIYLVAMIIISFFWMCNLDPWFLVIALVLVAAATIWMVVQHNKLKKLQKDNQEEA